MAASRPNVVVHTPISWIINWDYSPEREILGAAGVDLVVPNDAAHAAEVVKDADVVLVAGPFTAETIATLRDCVGLIAYSIGMDSIDSAAAAAAGIPVTNCPFCVDEVSDHALAMILAAERRLLPLAIEAAAGNWTVGPVYMPIRRLRGQTLGIIGAGRIGRQVARKARVFGFRTIAYDPYLPSDPDPELRLRPLETVLQESDVLATCALLTDETRGMINESIFAKVKPGVILVNIARGGLIDEAALARALRDGRVSYAALDVRVKEPPDPAQDPLAGLPNVLLTQHIAGASIQAREDLHVIAANTALDLLHRAGRLA